MSRSAVSCNSGSGVRSECICIVSWVSRLRSSLIVWSLIANCFSSCSILLYFSLSSLIRACFSSFLAYKVSVRSLTIFALESMRFCSSSIWLRYFSNRSLTFAFIFPVSSPSVAASDLPSLSLAMAASLTSISLRACSRRSDSLVLRSASRASYVYSC